MIGTRTLNDVFIDMAQHSEDNPGHGHNCSCKDIYIREIRNILRDTPMLQEFMLASTYILRTRW